MNRNSNLFVLIAGVAFALTGALILVIFGMQGILNPWGITLGILFGLWICSGYLIGRNIYAESRRPLKHLLIFMACFMAIGFAFHFGWQLTYIEAHRGARTFLAQVSGIFWSASLAVIYLAYQGYRRSEK